MKSHHCKGPLSKNQTSSRVFISKMLDQIPHPILINILLHLNNVKDFQSLASTCTACNRSLNTDDDLWKAFAQQRWNLGQNDLAVSLSWVTNWKSYVFQRMPINTLPHISPTNLIQEHFATDSFQHLVCCCLISRTSGSQLLQDALLHILSAFPHPSHWVDTSNKDTLMQLIHPFGLQDNRYKTISTMADDFLFKDWSDPAIAFHGCGPFCSHSWLIFCRGLRSSTDEMGRKVTDVNLNAVLSWIKGGLGRKKGRWSEGEGRGGGRRKRKQVAESESDVKHNMKVKKIVPVNSSRGGNERRMTRSMKH